MPERCPFYYGDHARQCELDVDHVGEHQYADTFELLARDIEKWSIRDGTSCMDSFADRVRRLGAKFAGMQERCAKVADKEAENAEKSSYIHERDRQDRELGALVSRNIASAIRGLK
jgi:hypothetical protein